MAAPRKRNRQGKGSQLRQAIRNEQRRGGGPISSEFEQKLRSSRPSSADDDRSTYEEHRQDSSGTDHRISSSDQIKSSRTAFSGYVMLAEPTKTDRDDTVNRDQKGRAEDISERIGSHNDTNDCVNHKSAHRIDSTCDDTAKDSHDPGQDDRANQDPKGAESENMADSTYSHVLSSEQSSRPSSGLEFNAVQEAINTQLEDGNYATVSQLYTYWSSMFNSDTSLWMQYIDFERQHGTYDGWASANAKAVGALYFKSEGEGPIRYRINILLDFLRNSKWPEASRVDTLQEILNGTKNLTPFEETRLYRELYFYKLIGRGIDVDNLEYAPGDSLLIRTKNLGLEERRYAFECLLLKPPPKNNIQDYIHWGSELADYGNLRQDEKLYKRLVGLCPTSTNLMMAYIRFLRRKYRSQEAENKILELVYENAEFFPTGELWNLKAFKQRPEAFRAVFYNRLSREPAISRSWLNAIEYESTLSNHSRYRALCELALEQIREKGGKRISLELIWSKYAKVERERGTHYQYVNVLRRWLRAMPNSRLLWDEIVEYWYGSHGSMGAQSGLYCMSCMLKGKELDNFQKDVKGLLRKYEVRKRFSWAR